MTQEILSLAAFFTGINARATTRTPRLISVNRARFLRQPKRTRCRAATLEARRHLAPNRTGGPRWPMLTRGPTRLRPGDGEPALGALLRAGDRRAVDDFRATIHRQPGPLKALADDLVDHNFDLKRSTARS